MSRRDVHVLIEARGFPDDNARLAFLASGFTLAPVLHRLPHAHLLVEGRLVARWDRFIAEVRLIDGSMVRAHCVNPGRMEGQLVPGSRVWLTPAPEGSKRKLRYTWTLMEHEGRLVGVDTSAPNRIVEAALAARAIPGLRRYRALRREVQREGGSRVDFVLEGARPHLVEVKNCHLVYPDERAYFPDTVSERATRHVEHLAGEVRSGRRATVLFVVQRPGPIRALRPSMLHDPVLADACRAAAAEGVRFRALQVVPTLEAYEVAGPLKVDLRPYDPEPHVPWRDAGRKLGGWRRSNRKAASSKE